MYQPLIPHTTIEELNIYFPQQSLLLSRFVGVFSFTIKLLAFSVETQLGPDVRVLYGTKSEL